MAKPYSMDLRVRVVRCCDEGEPPEVVAKRFSVSPAWVYRLLQRRREQGDLNPKSGKPGPKFKVEDRRMEILSELEHNPNLTLEEIKANFHLACCLQTISNALVRWGITLKKSHSGQRTTAA